MKRLNLLLTHTAKGGFILLLFLVISSTPAADAPYPVDPIERQVTQGALRVKIADEVVECPLKHTDVKVNITGFIARATVTQTFHNPYDENIEAVYVFPLPHAAAIDAMTMKIGERNIVGVMKRRAQARAIYEQAIQQGQTASLLEQERPNIFTQSVGNIQPRQEIRIEISYVDVLDYDMGTYEFHFPMVVGPRYIPGTPISKKPQVPRELEGKVGEVKERITKITLSPAPSGTGWAPDTNRVPDASRITPPVLKPGYRTGHDIRLSVSLDAGVPVQDIEIINHAAVLERIDTSKATVEISPLDAIPNKDFVMKYKVVGEKPEMAVFAHATGPEQRYFMLMIQPKLNAELAKVPPRELVFLLDVSGSMSGEPMAKVKATMRHFLQRSTPKDTLQVITFAGQANSLFEKSVPVTEANMARALTFTEQLHGGGGTEMLEGIKAVLNAPVDPKRVRIVVMLTDGYIGNEEEIIAEVGRRAGDAIRFWTIGIGSSPNHFLIEGVAKQGGGMSKVLDLNTNPKELVTQVVERIHRAQLADIQMDWGQLAVYETYPRRIPELWAGRPVILFGRYAAGGKTEITLSGTAEGQPLTYTLNVTLPDADPTHDVLAKVWARKKIEDLSGQTFYADTPEVIEEITRIALDYRLMSQYTSFVAVDESEMKRVNQQAEPPRRVVVPVPLPEGVDFQGIFGQQKFSASANQVPLLGRRNGLNADDYDGYRGRYSEFAIGDSNRYRGRYSEFAISDSNRFKPAYINQTVDASAALAPTSPIVRQFGPIEANGLNTDALSQKYQYPSAWVVEEVLNTLSLKRQEYAKTAVTEAHALQQGGHLEEARLRYQHALGLMAGIQTGDDTAATAATAIQALNEAILKKRAEAYPGLNRKLDSRLRNQPLADAIRTVVNAGGFRLDLVPGSLDDVATLLNLPECRVTYLDLQRATIAQALEWLLTPYHLTWRMKDAETITIGTAHRMQGTSVWGYNIYDILMPLIKAEFDEAVPLKSVENALTGFLKTIKVFAGHQASTHLAPDSAVFIDLNRLLIYGAPDVHEKVSQFLEVLREGEADIASIIEGEVSEKMYTDLKALQKLTAAQSKTFAKVREMAAAAAAYNRVVADLKAPSLQLLAAAVSGEIDIEALTRLQMAWAAPQLEPIIEKEKYGRLLGIRSAWCIRTAAQAVPTHAELAALSEHVLLKAKEIELLKSQGDSAAAYLETLYAVLVDQNGITYKAARTLIKQRESVLEKIVGLIAESLISPSEDSDKALQAALSAHQIYGDDLLLLTGLIVKRRGGQLWQTFREELPHIAKQHLVNGHIWVILNRLEASRNPIWLSQ